MAKATKVIHRIEPDEEEIRKRDLEQVEAALLENKEAVADTLELLRRLQENRVLEILNAALAESEQVVDHIVRAVDNSDTTKSVKNMLLLFDTLGTLNMEELEPLILKVNKGVSKVAEYEHGRGSGYAALLRSITDKEVMEGLNTLMAFVKGFGINQEDREMMEEEHHEEEDHEKQSKSQKSSPAKKWYVAAAGVSLLALPMLFKK